ncbi:GatB/YqeY domain-containing protein [Porphyromonas sp.]|uniref:GatB/YqeY domain-containing protein n=1 Tax=Porphyromonas sp. TaxID=1924944 RepID=UPI0026DB7980|nr:GatB/YqeY domain-containing protein [Porphyromonas sp.]MDO4770382.1 GatB/YqeY domain-containing protein [Porphyromonas sp.]
MSTLVEKINDEIKKAMLAKEKLRLEALRAVKKEFLEALTAKGASGELEDGKALQIISKLVKQREESAKIYREQARPDLAEVEEAQAEALKEYLPQQLSEEEVRAEVSAIIAKLGVSDMKGMGQVMGVASKALSGRADGKLIADIVKALLS